MTTALEEIRARAEKATLGPWDATRGSDFDGVDTLFGTLTTDDHGGEVFKPADAEFIAYSRTDVPKLVAALEAVLGLANHEPRFTPVFGAAHTSRSVAADKILEVIQEALQ